MSVNLKDELCAWLPPSRSQLISQHTQALQINNACDNIVYYNTMAQALSCHEHARPSAVTYLQMTCNVVTAFQLHYVLFLFGLA